MKIKEIREDAIVFDNGNMITYYHLQDCCEDNYADFEQLDDLARAYDFDESTMCFVAEENVGFRFGDSRQMFFVPCYSEQNGYYNFDVDIYYNDKKVLSVDGEWVSRD